MGNDGHSGADRDRPIRPSSRGSAAAGVPRVPTRPTRTLRAWVRPLISLFLLALVACGSGAATRTDLRVFAAASLTAVFQTIAADLEREHRDVQVELVFAGSSQLALQLREGAAADLFASADLPNLQKVVDAGLTVGAPREFARNRLAILVARGNPHGIRTLADLAREDLRVALCGPEVPAGRYAREALAKAGVSVRSRTDETNVKALTSKVHLGELDAALAYRTDAASAGLEAIPLAAEHDVVASYPVAVLGSGKARALAELFVERLLAAPGRAALVAAGFEAP